MICPACGEALAGGQERCPACGSALAAPTEGALAPDLMRHEPPRDRLAEVPAFKKREPSWKDEVRERVRHRKRYRTGGPELPLFPDKAETMEEPPTLAPPAPSADAVEEVAAAPDRLPPGPAAEAADAEASAEVVDLPLRPQEARDEPDEPMPIREASGEPPSGPHFVELGQPPVDQPAAAWTADDLETDPAAPARPIERPAYLGERAQAALLDGVTLGLVAAVVVYFASRAARVPPLGLLPAWPYVAGFLALFALVYAAFFTGLTGQTLGKMAFRLRVVDRAGSPPGHVRAALRAALGALGSLALVGIAPVLFDPARRALHDRLLKTRVIRI